MHRLYHHSANAVWWLHLAWIFLLVLGIPAIVWNPAYGMVELGLVGLTVLAQLLWRGCPLTLLEEGWRMKHDPRYERRTAFIQPLLERIGIKRRIGLSPVHLGVVALAVFLLIEAVG